MAVAAGQDPFLDAEGSARLLLTTGDQAVGAALAGTLAVDGAEREPVHFETHGFAGQGLGFAATTGMSIRHAGYANDCVGEVMGGEARIVVVPPEGWGGTGVPISA